LEGGSRGLIRILLRVIDIGDPAARDEAGTYSATSALALGLAEVPKSPTAALVGGGWIVGILR
jgi:hypothetical protein